MIKSFLRPALMFLPPFSVVLGLMLLDPPEALPIAKPIVVTRTLTLSEVRDTLVVHFAQKYGVDTALALDVSHAENWTGDTAAVNPRSGAIGLMQVMPLWKGTFPECGTNLSNGPTNVCYGILILRNYLIECERNTFCATNKYNGAKRTATILSYQSELGRARGRRSGS